MTYTTNIPPGEQRALRAFCDLAEQIETTRFFKTYWTQDHKITWETDANDGRLSVTTYDTDDLRSFLVLFRRLVAEQEPTQVYRVLAIVGRYVRPEMRQQVREAKGEFRRIEDSTGGLKFLVGPAGSQREFSPRAIRDLYFNAGLFHDDETLEADRALLRDFEPTVLVVLVRYVMLTAVTCRRLADAIRAGGFLDPNPTPPV